MAGDRYLSQEGQMLHNEMGAFGFSSAAFSADDNALKYKAEL